MRKGYEKIIKRINSISKHDSELLQQFSNYLTIQEADAIYDTIALRYYGIKNKKLFTLLWTAFCFLS